MRKLMLLDNATLDGHLARRSDPNAAVLLPVVAEQFDWQADLLAAYDTLLIGRVSYVKAASFWPTHPSRLAARLNEMTKVVFSGTLDRLDWANSRLATAEPAEELARLRDEPGRNICVKGSPTLARALSRQHLIDEYVLIVHPIIAGGDGIPHFDDPADLPALTLLDVTELTSDAVALTYARA
ncbi:MAG TPA: dihydrofolate reductase family protein [Pseudonocardia sp.]|nr:dihydrofolate reductase family protein [Pseudonocardia sp.]